MSDFAVVSSKCPVIGVGAAANGGLSSVTCLGIGVCPVDTLARAFSLPVARTFASLFNLS